jgi:hypothetical protein
MKVEMKVMVLVILEVCPSLLYFTMYSLLTVYFAQLSYTVKGLPFFHVRNSWFITNLLLYVIVVLNFVLESSAKYVYLSIFTAYVLNSVVVVWFSVSVFNYFPSAASGNITRVTKRLFPLVVMCFTGLVFNDLNYFICFMRAAHVYTYSAHDLYLPILSKPSMLEILTLVMAETIPSVVFLFLVSKRQLSGEESSLLTTVVDSASNANPMTRFKGGGEAGGEEYPRGGGYEAHGSSDNLRMGIYSQLAT